ncbi:hypothetical protein LP420_13585 [Massilia sp. B-10]|nr:hypothetical protein LP420_13585 [Massilia sp. B-10]
MILYGRKYVPQDIEAAVGCLAIPACARTAAPRSRSPWTAPERLVLVHELERVWVRRSEQHGEIVTAVRRAVSAAQAIQVDDVVLIRPGALPRTSSGKVRRGQCRLDYLSGALRAEAPAEAVPA